MVCCDHLCLSFASHAWCDSTRLLDMAIRTHKTYIVYSVYSDHPNDSVHHCLFTQQNQAHREQFVRHNCLKCFSFILEFISIYLFFIFSSWWIWIKIKITNELELKIKLKKNKNRFIQIVLCDNFINTELYIQLISELYFPINEMKWKNKDENIRKWFLADAKWSEIGEEMAPKCIHKYAMDLSFSSFFYRSPSFPSSLSSICTREFSLLLLLELL